MSVDDFILEFADDVVEAAQVAAETPRRQNLWRDDPLQQWSSKAYVKTFRLTKELTNNLLAELEPVIQSTTQLDLKTMTLCAMNFLGQGSYQTPVGENRSVSLSQASVSRCISAVVEALNHPQIFNKWVSFPSTFEEMNAIARDFYSMNGIPGIVGCIDCTHVAIVPPAALHFDERSYVNRKSYHSINTQLICDANLKILNVNALFPGGTHDCHIWNNSNVQSLMQDLYRSGNTNYHLIGDSGYPLRPWCLTPIRGLGEDDHSPEAQYSKALTKTRCAIERCNGVLKGRFRCLTKDRVLHYTPNKATKIINACVVLHNTCVTNNVEHINYSDLDDYQLGVIQPAPAENIELPATSRGNMDLLQGRAKQAHIVNNYFS